MQFIRSIQQHVTANGDHYVLSIPREIAQALQLDDGGLVLFEVKDSGVAIQPYEDSPLLIDQFNPEFIEDSGMRSFVKVPLTCPTTRGKSKDLVCQSFKPCTKAHRLALKVLKRKIDEMLATPSGRASLAAAFRRRGLG